MDLPFLKEKRFWYYLLNHWELDYLVQYDIFKLKVQEDLKLQRNEDKVSYFIY
jgi:hypothetical protein